MLQFVGTYAQVVSVANAVDAALSLPCCTCDVSPVPACACTRHTLPCGSHASHAVVTRTWAQPVQHPTNAALWAYPIDSVVTGLRGASATIEAAVSGAIDRSADWLPTLTGEGV